MHLMHEMRGMKDSIEATSLDEETKGLLRGYNPQWEGSGPLGHIERVFPRDALGEVQAHLDLRHIIVLSGPRRSGKTVVMRQMVQSLLDRGVDPRMTMYFSFDGLTSRSHQTIPAVVQYYLGQVAPARPTRTDRAYLFLDEVQFIHDWSTMLMRLYETEPNLKMFVSGSSSLAVRKGSGESLAGRRFDIPVRQLSFREYLGFKGVEVPRTASLSSTERLPGTLDMRSAEIADHLSEYLLKGGYPETVSMAPASRSSEYLRQSVIEKVVYHDLPEIEGIRDPRTVMHLVKIAASMSGRLFEVGNVGSALGIDRNKASAYVSMLERAQLLAVCYNYSRSRTRQARTSKRLYMTDTGLISALLGYEAAIAGPEIGRLAETTAFNHLSRTREAYFWRDSTGNEVDLVLVQGNKVVPVEVKYQSSITKGDAKGLVRFCEVHGAKDPVMITRDTSGTMDVGGYGIRLVPMWRALLSV